MRFEAEYLALQEPLYSSYCITYGRFKTAIKIEHGLAREEGRLPDHAATIKYLEQQCELVDTLHQRERSRLSQLFEQSMSAHKKLRSGEYKSPTFIKVGMHICKNATEYTFAAGQSLLLFAKINTEAARRIEKKIHRSCNAQIERLQWQLPKCAFFYRTTASATYDFKANASIYGAEASDAEFNSLNPKEVATLVDVFLAGSSLGPTYQASTRKQRLSSMIELMSFSKQYNGVKPHDLLNEVPNSPTTTSLSIDLLAEIGNVGAKLDGASLSQLDEFSRSPIHYAAQYGLSEVLLALVAPRLSQQTVNSWFHPRPPLEDQISPFVLAICSGRKYAVKRLLFKRQLRVLCSDCDDPLMALPSHLARIALEGGEIEILELILSEGTSVNTADDLGQLLLCTAVSRKPEICQRLLQLGASVNLLEPSSGRTALCLSCIRGDMALVRRLLDHGANPTIRDSRGWLPIEHAAYRGHLGIAKLLSDRYRLHKSLDEAPFAVTPLVQTDLTFDSPIPWLDDSSDSPGSSGPHFSFDSHGSSDTHKGHYLWLTLGNNDAKTPVQALRFNKAPWPSKTPSGKGELLYSIEVSVIDAKGKPGDSHSWRLPLLECSVNKPWLVKTDSIDDLKLSWKLFLQMGELLATGICLVGNLNTGSRQHRESVVRSATVPIISPRDSSFAGSITFSYFSSKPHPPPQHLRKPHFWDFGNGVGGHRGSGKNMIDEKKLQIGENTAQSFSTAISHGASFLEFDVQLTKDLVPVVYHDFLISETGTDSTVQNLTYNQFKTINSVQTPKRPAHSRSNSMESADYQYLESFKERMDQTHFNKINGFKANTRGNFIHEKTCSLEEVFRHVSPNVPLNIELKYPMLFETEDWDMEPTAIKTDIFVDTILDKVYKYAEGRTIVFSSFSPEVCIALSTKQRSFPVFFLSKTAAPKGEIRSCCIQQAIHFAKTWGLPGIVAECTPFILCPRLIGYVKSAGLALTSFGVGNSNKEHVKIQFSGGINAVISDNIRAIKELAEGEDKPEPTRVYS